MTTPEQGPTDEEKADLEARVARLKEEVGEHVEVPTRADLGRFLQDPRVIAARGRLSDAEYHRQMREADLQAGREVDQSRRTVRWEQYVGGGVEGVQGGARRYDYATASYDELDGKTQNPANKVTGWWGSGSRTLLLAGPADTGKTHAAYAVANTVAAADRDAEPGVPAVSVRAWSAIELADALRPQEGAGNRIRQRVVNEVTTCDLLLLDDLGREKESDWWREQLFRILDSRISDGRRRQIVTLNAQKGKVVDLLEERYGSPIATRLSHEAVGAFLEGSPHRSMAVWKDPFA